MAKRRNHFKLYRTLQDLKERYGKVELPNKRLQSRAIKTIDKIFDRAMSYKGTDNYNRNEQRYIKRLEKMDFERNLSISSYDDFVKNYNTKDMSQMIKYLGAEKTSELLFNLFNFFELDWLLQIAEKYPERFAEIVERYCGIEMNRSITPEIVQSMLYNAFVYYTTTKDNPKVKKTRVRSKRTGRFMKRKGL